MAPPRCIGSARDFGSTTTRRCWRQCAGRAVCAAFTSSTLGSRPPLRSGSTDGGEGPPGRGRGLGSGGGGDAAWPLRLQAKSTTPRHANQRGMSCSPVPTAGTPWPGEGAAGRPSRVSREESRTREAVSHQTNGLGGPGPDESASALSVTHFGPLAFLWDKDHDPHCTDETLKPQRHKVDLLKVLEPVNGRTETPGLGL